jgi:hypothetical protein
LRQDRCGDSDRLKKVRIVRSRFRRRFGQKAPRQKTAIAQKWVAGPTCEPIEIGFVGVLDQPLGQLRSINSGNSPQGARKPKDICDKNRAHRSRQNIDAAKRPRAEAF